MLGALALLAPALARAQEEIGLPVGTPAPASVQVQDLEGRAVDLSDYYGKKPVIIEFWATWCPLCKALLPRLEAAHRKHGDKVDFLVVAVAVNETIRSVNRHMEKEPMPFRIFWDAKGAAVRAFEAPSTSYIVGLDAAGKVAYTGLGDQQDIEAAIRKVSGER